MPAGSTGTVRLEYEGPANALAVDGGLEDEKVGFSAVLPTRLMEPSAGTESAAPHAVTFGTAGLMIGRPDKMMEFPASTSFSVYAVVQNTGSNVLTVSTTVFYERSGAQRSLSLTPFALRPGEVKQVPVSAALASNGLADLSGSVNLAFSYTGQEADLLATSGSVDQTGTYVLESYFEAELPTASRTLCYWNRASGTDTMYTLWNYTSSKEDLVLRFYFAGGSYEVPVSLPAGGTYMLDLKDLIMEGKPDRNGKQFPADALEGSAKLEAPEGDKGTLHVVVSGATYNVKTATCVFRCINCNGVVTYYIVPGPFYLDIPGTVAATSHGQWNTGTTSGYTSTWSSDNTGVATPNSGQVSSVAPGGANVLAQSPSLPAPGQVCSYNVPVCNRYVAFQAKQPANVNSLTCSPSSVTRGSQVTCTLQGPGTASNWNFASSTISGVNVTSANGTTGTTWPGLLWIQERSRLPLPVARP